MSNVIGQSEPELPFNIDAKKTTIIINDVCLETSLSYVDYDLIKFAAGFNDSHHALITLTCGDENTIHPVVPGQIVDVIDDMIFNVHATEYMKS